MIYTPKTTLRQLKIMHLLNGEYFSGVEQVVVSIVKGLKGFDHIIVCLFDGPMAIKAREMGLEVNVLTMKNKFDLSIIQKLASLIKRKNVSIIHTHTWRANLYGRLVAKLIHIPVVSHIHSPVARESTKKLNNVINTIVERSLANFTDMFVTVSQSLKEELIRQRIKRDKIKTVYNCIDLNRLQITNASKLRNEFKIDKDVYLIGMIAMFRPRKGAEYLLKAGVKVREEIPKFKFVFIGDGFLVDGKNYLDYLKKLSQDLQLSDNIIFTGFRDDISDILSEIDLLVIPSLFGEGLPIVLLEAMAMKKPVVATPIEGIWEVIENGKTGLLVPPKCKDDLAEALITIFNDKHKAESMGIAARRLVEEKFSLNVMIEKIKKIYEDCLSRHSVLRADLIS